jgi:hypothetical protein
MPIHGLSLREALASDGAFETKNSTVYYNGEDGTHAVYDVTAVDEGSIVINGTHCTTEDGNIAISTNIVTSENYFTEHGIDIKKGWNTCP